MATLTAARTRATRELVANFLDNMQQALDHITTEMRYTDIDTFPARVEPGGGRSGGTTSTVERAVIDSRQRLRDTEQQLWDDYDAIVAIAHSGSFTACAALNRHVPAGIRCNLGANMQLDGWQTWRYQERLERLDGATYLADADCHNWPGNDPIIPGMCDACLTRMNIWRVGNDLSPIVRNSTDRNYKRGDHGRFT